jgi:hypothetical protein
MEVDVADIIPSGSQPHGKACVPIGALIDIRCTNVSAEVLLNSF